MTAAAAALFVALTFGSPQEPQRPPAEQQQKPELRPPEKPEKPDETINVPLHSSDWPTREAIPIIGFVDLKDWVETKASLEATRYELRQCEIKLRRKHPLVALLHTLFRVK